MLSNVATIKVENVFTLINNRNRISKINKINIYLYLQMSAPKYNSDMIDTLPSLAPIVSI